MKSPLPISASERSMFWTAHPVRSSSECNLTLQLLVSLIYEFSELLHDILMGLNIIIIAIILIVHTPKIIHDTFF